MNNNCDFEIMKIKYILFVTNSFSCYGLLLVYTMLLIYRTHESPASFPFDFTLTYLLCSQVYAKGVNPETVSPKLRVYTPTPFCLRSSLDWFLV